MTHLPQILASLMTFLLPAFADDPADMRPAQMLTTPDGVHFGIWPEKPTQPAPTVFIFAGSGEDTLNSAYFRQSGNALAGEGYLCVSVDLPCHGKAVKAGEPAGIDGWRTRLESGENFVAEATGRFRRVLDHLVEIKFTDADQVAACGTSRGGFMAVHFAAAEPRVKAVAAFAPVTDLLVLREFQKLDQRDLADSLSLKRQADRLADRAVWAIIGDRDDRVSTDECIAFCRTVTSTTIQMNRPARVNLHVLPEPQGHTTPKGAAALAAKWLAEELSPAK